MHCVRPARSAWVEQLWVASALLFLLPALNALTTQRPLWHSLVEGDWVFAGMDIDVLGALLCSTPFWRIRTARQRAGAPVPRASRTRQAPITVASQRGGGMENHLPAFALCLAGFIALAFAVRRQQRDIIGRPLPIGRDIRSFALAGACALLLCAGLSCRARKGWSHRPRDVQRSDQYRGRHRAVCV